MLQGWRRAGRVAVRRAPACGGVLSVQLPRRPPRGRGRGVLRPLVVRHVLEESRQPPHHRGLCSRSQPNTSALLVALPMTPLQSRAHVLRRGLLSTRSLTDIAAPMCSGHCRKLAPHWGKLASALKGVVRVGAVNCDADSALCQKHGCARRRKTLNPQVLFTHCYCWYSPVNAQLQPEQRYSQPACARAALMTCV